MARSTKQRQQMESVFWAWMGTPEPGAVGHPSYYGRYSACGRHQES